MTKIKKYSVSGSTFLHNGFTFDEIVKEYPGLSDDDTKTLKTMKCGESMMVDGVTITSCDGSCRGVRR